MTQKADSWKRLIKLTNLLTKLMKKKERRHKSPVSVMKRVTSVQNLPTSKDHKRIKPWTTLHTYVGLCAADLDSTKDE